MNDLVKLAKDIIIMKILLDPQVFNFQKYGGISRYYVEIFSRLNRKKDVVVVAALSSTQNEYFNNSNLFSSKSRKINRLIQVLNSVGFSTRKLLKKNNKKMLDESLKNDFDLFIPTYYDSYFLDKIGDKPFVLTVYDMIHELFPHYFINDPFNVTSNKKILVEKATKIIAVSNNTKKDILKIFPEIDESKIEVIYHGSSITVNRNSKIVLPNEYLLFVGARNDYKNFLFLLDTVKEILLENKKVILLCAGGGSFNEIEKKEIKKANLLDQVMHFDFKDEDLGFIYSNAKCFIFPSEYEGFGIPVVEAMKCECPVILPRSSSFPEVAGDAGIFYELNNKKELKEKIMKVLNDDSFRNQYIIKGIEQSKKFDWDIAAEECLELYKKVV